MPRTSQQFEEIRNEKRNVIIQTALELFANNGYASTSISQIAKKANISKGLMYNYFDSKEELLKTIVENLTDEIMEYLDSNHDNKTSEEEAMQFIDKYFEYMITKTEELKFFIQLAIQPEVIKHFSTNSSRYDKIHYKELLILFLKEQHPENSELLLLNFFSILKGLALQYTFSPQNYPHNLMMKYKEYIKKMFIKNKE
ncbi:TetR/AcrR family transcriptional regulator [Bacteroidales bacterium OttesenSCG-928-I21]|nr:TetR/AcrR family transcriptional regulator [Bacteroidales bacterium OttesenSCG-928-I21]